MKPKSRLNWFPAAGACLVTVCIQAVHADTGWTGASDTDFNNAGNWDNGAPAGQNARINTIAGNIATISANAGQMNEIFVARGGSPGLLNHSAGTASTAGWMDVGTDGGTGTYNLANFAGTGGTLTGLGLGSGSMTVGGQLYVGGTGYNDNGGTGTVNINTSGTLTVAGDIYVGKSGTGVINMDAGTLNRTGGWSVIGRNAGGNGAFNMSGGTVTAAGDTVIGLNAGSMGALNMTGGAYTTGGKMQIGRDGGNGTVNIGGAGTLTTNSWLVLGTGGGTGTLDMTGGTVNANSWLFLGDGAGASGTLNMSGGTVNANSWLFVGNGGSGTLNMSGGTVNAIDYTVIGKNTGGTGTVNIGSTGTFNTNGGLVLGGDGGTGTLNMTGGTVNQGTVNTGSRLELTNGGSTGNATVNLNGGTLAVNGIVANGTGAGTVLLNLNGGTLKANIANNDFINDGEIDRINVRNGGAVIDTDGENIRIANAILHSDILGDNPTDGGLTKTGAGTLTLSNANTYSGGTTVSAGRIEVTNNTALGSGAVSIAAGANVLLNANSLTIANDFTLNGTTSGGALVSGDRPGGNITTLSGTITLAADSNIASWWNDKQLTLSGKITGSGNLTFDRATALGDPVGGKFLISGTTNDYTGSTTVNGKSGGNAILQLGAANALPTGTTLTLNDANLSLLGFNQTLGGLVASTTTSRIVNGNATAVTLTVNNAAANTFAGVLGGFGTDENNFALTKGGAGALTLSGANTYSGATTVSAGTLKAGVASVANTSGAFGNNSAVTMANVATAILDITGFNTQIGSLTGGGTTGGSVTLGAATLTTGGDNTSPAAYAGVISGTGALTKIGTGTAILSGASTFSGGLTISNGTIVTGASSATVGGGVLTSGSLGTGSVTLAGGVLDLAGPGQQVVLNNIVVSPGTSTITNSSAGTINRLGATGTGLTTAQTVTGSGTLVLSANTGNMSLRELSWSGFTGTVRVDSGTMFVSNSTPIDLSGATLNMNGGTWAPANAAGGTQTVKIGTLIGTSTLTSNSAITTYEIGNLGVSTFGGTITTGGSGTNVTKVGTGTLTLSGTNTYAGATAVQLGKLVVSGFIGNSAVTVTGTNTTLASGTTGTIGSSVTMNSGAILAPGDVNAVGMATVGSGGLTLNSGSIFQWDLSGATGSLPTADQGSYDKVVANGTMSGTSIFNVVLGTSDFTDTFWDTAHTWSDIFTGSGVPADLAAIFTTFSGTDVNTNGSVTGQGGFSFNGTSTLTWTAVPEPTTALSGLLITAGLLRRRRKN